MKDILRNRFQYLIKLLMSPKKSMLKYEGLGLNYLIQVIVLIMFIGMFFSTLSSYFSYISIISQIKWVINYIFATVLIYKLIKLAGKHECLKTYSDDLKDYVAELFLKTAILVSAADIIISHLLPIHKLLYGIGSHYFVLFFIIMASTFYYGKRFRNSLDFISISGIIAFSFSLTIMLTSPVIFNLSGRINSFDLDHNYGAINENKIGEHIASLTNDNNLRIWLERLSTFHSLIVVDIDSAVNQMKDDKDFYVNTVTCINHLSRGKGKKHIESINKIIFTSSNDIDKYIAFQKSLSGHFYALPTGELDEFCHTI